MWKCVLMIIFGAGPFSFLAAQPPKLLLQTGNMDGITAVEYTPDGKFLAIGGPEDYIRLWDVESGREIRSFFLTGYTNKRFKFTPDGKRFIATASANLKIWKLVDGSEQLSLKDLGIEGSFAISPDGRILAVGKVGKIELIEINSGSSLGVIPGSDFQIKSIAFNPDGKQLAFSYFGGTSVEIWNVETRQRITVISSGAGTIETIAFNPKMEVFAAAYIGGAINLWNSKTWKDEGLLQENYNKIGMGRNSLIFSKDGRLLFNSWGKVNVWDMEQRKLLRSFGGWQNSMALNPDEKEMAMGTIALNAGEDSLAIVDIASEQLVKKMGPRSYRVNSISVSRDGNMLASGVESTLAFWNLETGQLENFFRAHNHSTTVVLFEEQNNILMSTDGNDIKVWDTSRPLLLAEYKNGYPQAFAHYKNFVATGTNLDISEGKTLRPDSEPGPPAAPRSSLYNVLVFNIAAGTEIRTKTGFPYLIARVSFSHDRKYFAAIEGGSIKVWDIENGEEVRSIETSGNGRALFFSPDGRYIVSSGSPAEVWDWQAARKIATLKNRNVIEDVTFSPDGKNIITSNSNWTSSGYDPDFEKAVKIWSLSTGKEVFRLSTAIGLESFIYSDSGKLLTSRNLSGLWTVSDRKTSISLAPRRFSAKYSPSQINDVVFSRDERQLFIALQDSTIRIWDIAADKEIGSLVFYGEGHWLVTNPEGFFDGTSKARNQILWQFNDGTFDSTPVETYFNDFFHPGLLQDVLAGKSPKPRPGAELEKIDRRQPKVEIVSVNGRAKDRPAAEFSTDQRLATVMLEVTDNTTRKKRPDHRETSGARDLRLFRNGSLVKIWHGDIFDSNGCEKVSKPEEPRRARCAVNVPVVAGANDFTAYAFNESNVKSYDDTLSLTGAEPLKRDGTLYVFAIGINKYARASYDLKFAVPDVDEISTVIRQQQDKPVADGQIKQYSRTEIITLTDEDATRRNILLFLNGLSAEQKAAAPADASEKVKAGLQKVRLLQPEDGLIIYYAGHGTSAGQRYFLLPHDYNGRPSEQGVSDLDLNGVLEKIDAGRILMIIDACESGQALGEQNEGRAPMNSKGLAQLAYDKGMLILAAAQSQQAAQETAEINGVKIEHGLLTYALLQGLTGMHADKDGNGQVWEREWLAYAAGQVPLLQREAMKQRHIQIENTKRGIEIFYAKGDAKGTAPENRKLQTPRIFYRREPEINPFIIAR